MLFAVALFGLFAASAQAANAESFEVVFNPAGKVPQVTMRPVKVSQCTSHPHTPAGGKLHVGHGAAAAYQKCSAALKAPAAPLATN